MLSLGNQLNALGQIAGGPAVDRIGNTSVRGALVLSGLLIVPTLPLPLLAHTARRAATIGCGIGSNGHLIDVARASSDPDVA